MMQYKPYGKTDKHISVIGAGGMRLPNPANHTEGIDVFLRARELGINYFDTAPYYCDDQSEAILGEAIRRMPPDHHTPLYISSKSSVENGAEFRQGIQKSLDRIGIPQIDFFHIWCVMNLDDWNTRLRGGVWEAALQAKADGLIGHICVSTHMKGEDIETLLQRHPEIEGLTIGYCAMNFPYRQRGIDAARRQHIGVAAMNPLGGGIIPQNPESFQFLQSENDPDIVTAALRFVVSEPGITTALVGFHSVEEVDAAVNAIHHFTPHSPERLQDIRNAIQKEFNEMCTGCGYCLPCPQNIPIPKYMDIHNLLQLKRPMSEIDFRFKLHWEITPSGAADCIACGLCESRCTQHLPIIQRLATLSQINLD